MSVVVRTWGLGYGWGGRLVRLTDEQFWRAASKRQLRYSLGEEVRRRMHNRAVDQFESESHPGADAATVSHDET